MRRFLLALVLASNLAAVHLPPAALTPSSPLVAAPALHRPKRGPSRDRSLPGKSRRRARRAA